MALFFDAAWFDARLAAAGLSRAVAAQALGLSDAELAELWKDQRELSARDVTVLAALLGATPQDIADRAGIATPLPRPDNDKRLAEIEARLAKLEAAMAALKAGQ